MKEISKEFLEYGSGGCHQKIKETLIKEIYVDTGRYSQYQEAARFGFKDVDNLIAGQNLYIKDTNKLTYKII